MSGKDSCTIAVDQFCVFDHSGKEAKGQKDGQGRREEKQSAGASAGLGHLGEWRKHL